MFLHESVRLACDINRAMRFFSVQSMAEKWLETPEIENKIEGQYRIGMTIDGMAEKSEWHGILKKKVYEKQILVQFDLHNDVEGIESETLELELNFMRSASRTEYCTDVHVVVRSFSDNDAGRKTRKLFANYWRARLEVLRAIVNGSWVIRDNDLNHSSLLASRL